VRIRKVAGVLIGAAVTFAMAAPAAAQDKTLATASVGYLYFHGATTGLDVGSINSSTSIPNPSGTKAYSKGFLLAATGRINDILSGVVEVGASFDPSNGHYLSGSQITTALGVNACAPVPPEIISRSCALSQIDAHGSMKIWNINTGMRFGTGSGKKWEAFGQFLVGWQRRAGQFLITDMRTAVTNGVTSTLQGTQIPFTNPATNTGSANNDGLNLQPGGGMDFWFSHKMGVRVQGDFERIKADTTVPTQVLGNSLPSRWTNNARFAISLVFQGVKK